METETYLVTGQPASATNLAVSELNYRPAPPTAAELALGFDDRSDFEFVEIMNISGVDVNLSGVEFTAGVEFRFDLGTVRFLSPGERVVIASNRDAFVARYGALYPGVRVAGEFTNNLSNDGETVIVSAANGSDIRNFTFNDVFPWPEAADGDGMSLVLINPPGNPDHNDPLNWRASLEAGGVPGGSDGTQFVGDPNDDDDQNGINNLLQYGLSAPGVPAALPVVAIEPLTVGGLEADYMTFSYTRNQAADDLAFEVEVSGDLVDWQGEAEGAVVLIARRGNGDGTETFVYRVAAPQPGPARLFARLSVTDIAP
jgi:hypothetical protein